MTVRKVHMQDATMRRFKVRLLVPIEITVECLTPAVALKDATRVLHYASDSMARAIRGMGAHSAVVGSHVEPEVTQLAPAYEPPNTHAPLADANGAPAQPETLSAPPMDDDARVVTVCDECLTASCWHGEFMCDASKNAGIVEKTVGELNALKYEHPDNYSAEKCLKVTGG